jgi:hypothetical protein
LLPEQKAARNILNAAFAMGIAEKFDEASGKALHRQQMALSQCSMRLCDDHGFDKELVGDVLWAYGTAMGFDARSEARPQALVQPLQPAPYPQPPSSQAISINDVEMQYYENLQETKTRYLGKWLQLTGIVKRIKIDNDCRRYIALCSIYDDPKNPDHERLKILNDKPKIKAFIAASQREMVFRPMKRKTIKFMGIIDRFVLRGTTGLHEGRLGDLIQLVDIDIINCELCDAESLSYD